MSALHGHWTGPEDRLRPTGAGGRSLFLLLSRVFVEDITSNIPGVIVHYFSFSSCIQQAAGAVVQAGSVLTELKLEEES